jgi:uncharacterized surface protein with fasciclin (FAS1) repeats
MCIIYCQFVTQKLHNMKIQKKLQGFMAVAALASMFTLSSCNKDDDPVPAKTNTITDVVVGNANFSVLKEAVVKADLATTLSGTGPFTVFAPDNAAFSAAGITSAGVTATSAADLKALLLYHTLPGKILAAGVPAGPNAKVVTAGGDSVFLTKNGAGVFVNGIKVAAADIPADNGVIHQLSVALNKPKGNIVATAIAATGGDNGLDSLVAAVTAAGLGTTLSGGLFTVFAPTNKAFRGLLTALNLPNVKSIPVATLTKVLTYHVLGARAFSSDLTAGALTMFQNGSTTISLTGPTIKGAANTAASNIIATNIMCSNGVVHVIDAVLLPN